MTPVPFIPGQTVERWLASPISWHEIAAVLMAGAVVVICVIFSAEIGWLIVKGIGRVVRLARLGRRYEQTMMVKR